ncbi:hypothetical protein PMAYCL1PPCAC_16342, partial [Pristionchus mayeri]
KEYAVVLLHTSLIELASVISHALVDGRLFIHSESVFCISSGPCHLISESFCSIVVGYMNVNIINSTAVIALSFWYRMRIVQLKGVVGRAKLHVLIFLLFCLYLPHIVTFHSWLSPKSVLEKKLRLFYDVNEAYGLHGFVDITEPIPAALVAYLVIFPYSLTIYIIFARQKV